MLVTEFAGIVIQWNRQTSFNCKPKITYKSPQTCTSTSNLSNCVSSFKKNKEWPGKLRVDEIIQNTNRSAEKRLVTTILYIFHDNVILVKRGNIQNHIHTYIHLMNNCVESIYKTQKTRMKVLPSTTVGE